MIRVNGRGAGTLGNPSGLAPRAGGFGSCLAWDDFVLDSTRMDHVAPAYRTRWGVTISSRVWNAVKNFCTQESIDHHIQWDGPQDGDVPQPSAQTVLDEIDLTQAQSKAAMIQAQQLSQPNTVDPAILAILNRPLAAPTTAIPPKISTTTIALGVGAVVLVGLALVFRNR